MLFYVLDVGGDFKKYLQDTQTIDIEDTISPPMRADFLGRILEGLDLEINRKSGLVDARFAAADKETTAHKLDMLGHLLGAIRLMDIYLKDESIIEGYMQALMDGRYHFATIAKELWPK